MCISMYLYVLTVFHGYIIQIISALVQRGVPGRVGMSVAIKVVPPGRIFVFNI